MLHQNCNRTPVYFKLDVSASYKSIVWDPSLAAHVAQMLWSQPWYSLRISLLFLKSFYQLFSLEDATFQIQRARWRTSSAPNQNQNKSKGEQIFFIF